MKIWSSVSAFSVKYNSMVPTTSFAKKFIDKISLVVDNVKKFQNMA